MIRSLLTDNFIVMENKNIVNQLADKAIKLKKSNSIEMPKMNLYRIKNLYRCFCFILLVLVTLSCEKTEDEDFNSGGLIKNGSAEFGASQPDNWLSYSGDYVVSWDTKETYDGNHSFKIASNDISLDKIGYWVQAINDNIPINKKVKLSLFAKLDNITGEGIHLMIRGDDKDGNFVFSESNQGTTKIIGSSDWKMISLNLENNIPASVSSLYVILIMSNYTQGAVYFDKISLSEQ